MYILECVDGSYYTGSTIDLERRFLQHSNGEGANHTKKRLPVKLVYFEEYSRIDTAFYGKSKFNVGEERKKKHLLGENFKNYQSWLREPQPTLKRGSQPTLKREHQPTLKREPQPTH